MTDTDKTQEILNFWFQGVNDTTVINKKSVPFFVLTAITVKQPFIDDHSFMDKGSIAVREV